MKICVATGTFHPEAGGPPTYLYGLLAELVARGHEVAVITYGDVEQEHDYPYPVTRISRRQSIPLRLAKFTGQVLRQGRRCDLLFVNDYGLPAAVANLWLRKPMAIKIVGDFAWEYAIRHHLIPAAETIDQFQARRHPWRVRLLKGLQRFYTGRAEAVVVPSRYLAGIVAGWGVRAERIRVVYNALDLSRYEVGISPEEARRRLNLSQQVILTVARLTPWKGIDRLIEVLPALRRAVPQTRLVIVGDGPERTNLERLARECSVADHVTFAGHVPHDDIPLWLRAAEVFVLYSGYEGLPHVVLEAMAVGVPVVTSDRGGNVEVVEDRVTGLLVPWGDLDGLQAALTRILSEEGLGAALAERARTRVAQTFERENMIRHTLDVFEAVVG